MHNTLYQLYKKTSQKYRKLSSRLEKSIVSGRFWKETKYRQNQLVNRVEKIRLKLERLELQLRIAIAGGLVIAGLIGTSDYASAQGLGPFIEITDRSVHPLPLPLEWTSNLSAYPSYADLDGDGDIDLFVTINSNINFVYPNADDEVLYYENLYNSLGRHFALQNPTTPFVSKISGFTDRRMPEFVDIDNDGDLDAFTNKGYSSIFTEIIFLYNNNGVFEDRTADTTNPFLGVSFYERSLSFVDLDGDGDFDAFANGRFFRNTGTASAGIFKFESHSFDALDIEHLAFIDMDSDGDQDAITADSNGYLHFFKNDNVNAVPPFQTDNWTQDDNEIRFAPLMGIKFGTEAIPKFVDIDNDGDLDLMVMVTNDVYPNPPSTIQFWENDGNNYFSLAPGLSNPFGGVDVGDDADPAWGDIDGDGDMDLFVGSKNKGVVFYEMTNTGAGDYFLPKTGAQNPLNIVGTPNNTSPALADMDNDGDLDAYVGIYNALQYFKNNGNSNIPSFLPNDAGNSLIIQLELTSHFNDLEPALGNLDIDSDIDAFVNSGYNIFNNMYQFDNTGDPANPSFVLGPEFGTYLGFRDIQLTDIDHDGDVDLIVGSNYSVISFFENQSASFVQQTGASNPFNSFYDYFSSPSFIDFDNDGDLDLFLGDKYGQIRYFRNENIPPTVNLDPSPLVFIENDPAVSLDLGLTISDPDANTNMVTGRLIITNFVPTEDVITYTTVNGIVGVVSGNTINFKGVATPLQWQGALQTVTFQNTSDDPNPTSRTISFEVRDSDFTDPVPQQRTIIITPINDPPAIVSAAGLTATEDVLYTYTAGVSDPDDVNNGTELTWSLSNQPAGMVVSSTGVVTWTPGEGVLTSGPVTITVQDGGEDGAIPDTEVFTVTVTQVNDPPSITSTAGLTATEDVLYSYTATVADPDDLNDGTELSWLLTNEPVGMVISSTGVVTWTPTEGVLTSGLVTITVQDGGEDGAIPDTEVFTVTVTQVNDPPSITSTAGLTATEDVLYTYTASVSDPDDANNGTDLTWSLSGQPAGMTVSSTGVVTWTPDDPIITPVSATLTVQDGGEDGALPDSETLNITVTPVNDPPSITSTAPITADEGVEYIYTATVSDPDDSNNGTDLIWSLSNEPFGMVVGTTGVVTWTPGAGVTTSGTVTLTVQDGGENGSTPTTETFTISVTPANAPPSITLATTDITFTEGDSPLSIDNTLTLSDDEADLASATVTITNFVKEQDNIGFTTPAGITGNMNVSTGILTFSGTASISDYQAALRSITYDNTSQAPDIIDRIFNFSINDGTATSSTSSRTVKIVAVNDAPTLFGTSSDLSYRSLTGSIVIDDQISITDVDNADISGATVSVSVNYSVGEDLLGFTDQNGITGSFNSVSGVLTLSGTASIAVYQAALASVTYENTVAAPSAATKQISFTVTDASDQSNTTTRTINITPNQVIATTINTQAGIGGSVTIDVQGQATFDPADQITTTIISDPSLGVAVVNADGSITYTPNDNAFGTDQIGYELCNQFNSCDSETITIDIQNDPPVVQVSETAVDPGGKATINLADAISDVNDNVDVSSIAVIFQPSSGAIATIDANFNLVVDYSGTSFTGADRLTIEVCDLSGACTEQEIIIIVGELERVNVFNAVSPNGDGLHDFLNIQDIEFFATNEVFIYDKLGRLVYSQENYDNSDLDRVFVGVNNDGEKLPDGTYYYAIILTSVEGNKFRQSGFFLLQQ